jgi:hypothetical protein
MNKARSGVALTALALGLLGAGAASAAPQGDPPEVLAETDHVTVTRDGDWVRHDFTEPVGRNVEQREYDGRRADHGGCRFSGEQTVGPEDAGKVFEERQIAVNLRDCTMITEVGEIDRADDVPQEGMRSETEVADAEGGLVAASAVTAAPNASEPEQAGTVLAASSNKSAWHRTFYEDPPGLDVNSAKTNVSWSYNGSCVTNSWGHSTNYDWLWQSGWTKVASGTTSWQGCSYARTTSNSEFLNGVFCATIDTRTEYRPNELKGQENGNYTMAWDADAWGGCSSWLSFHRSWGSS